MIDRFREQIEARLHEITHEADRLRGALGALTHDGQPAAASDTSPSNGAPRRARAVTRVASATKSRSGRSRRASGRGSSSRTAPGATKAAVLDALTGGEAMTAGEVATKTGLGRATISTTLSKLASSGEVQKAARGYRLAPSTGARSSARAK